MSVWGDGEKNMQVIKTMKPSAVVLYYFFLIKTYVKFYFLGYSGI